MKNPPNPTNPQNRSNPSNPSDQTNPTTKQQIKDALGAFADADLRAASIGLLNTLGYQSEKTIDLDNTPDAFLAEFDRRDRKLRKDKALLRPLEIRRFPVSDYRVCGTGLCAYA